MEKFAKCRRHTLELYYCGPYKGWSNVMDFFYFFISVRNVSLEEMFHLLHQGK